MKTTAKFTEEQKQVIANNIDLSYDNILALLKQKYGIPDKRSVRIRNYCVEIGLKVVKRSKKRVKKIDDSDFFTNDDPNVDWLV